MYVLVFIDLYSEIRESRVYIFPVLSARVSPACRFFHIWFLLNQIFQYPPLDFDQKKCLEKKERKEPLPSSSGEKITTYTAPQPGSGGGWSGRNYRGRNVGARQSLFRIRFGRSKWAPKRPWRVQQRAQWGGIFTRRFYLPPFMKPAPVSSFSVTWSFFLKKKYNN